MKAVELAPLLKRLLKIVIEIQIASPRSALQKELQVRNTKPPCRRFSSQRLIEMFGGVLVSAIRALLRPPFFARKLAITTPSKKKRPR